MMAVAWMELSNVKRVSVQRTESQGRRRMYGRVQLQAQCTN